jgi:hypothetical protein
MAEKKPAKSVTVEITQLEEEGRIFCIVGTSPLIFNRMAEKAKRQLLFPEPTLNAAARAARLKHEPLIEYRDSVYRDRETNPATRPGAARLAFLRGRRG